MNIETRMPSRVSSATNGFKALNPPTTSRPPSVVRSVRFSGTRQQACGRILSAMSSMASVAAISKLSGFEIEALRRTHVVIEDVPAVLAQMRRDAVGASFDRHERRANGIGDRAAARVADGRDMIDVDAKPERCHRAAPLSFGPVRPRRRARGCPV